MYPDGTVCISILHDPGDDKYGYESANERWSPVHKVETILISVISMLSSPNDQSPANIDAAVRNPPLFSRQCIGAANVLTLFFSSAVYRKNGASTAIASERRCSRLSGGVRITFEGFPFRAQFVSFFLSFFLFFFFFFFFFFSFSPCMFSLTHLTHALLLLLLLLSFFFFFLNIIYSIYKETFS